MNIASRNLQTASTSNAVLVPYSLCASSVNLEPRAVYSAKPHTHGAAEQVDLRCLLCKSATLMAVVELLGSLYVQYTCIIV